MSEIETSNDKLNLRKDILWGMYQEHRVHARHNETLRSAINNMLIVASAALVSFVIYDKEVNSSDLPAAILLIGFGLLGFIFSTSYTERTLEHKRRADQYWNELDSLLFKRPVGRTMAEITRAADAKHRTFVVRSIRSFANSHLLWIVFPLFISLIGIYLTVSILRKH